jgi:hypothetical protein
MDKDKLLKKLKNMKQYKDLPPEELEKVVQKKIDEEVLLTAFVGIDDTKKPKAIQLYEQYLSENSFESLAEKSTLIDLVYLEMLNDQIKEYIEQEQKEHKGALPVKMMEQLVTNNTQILELKEKLGMMKDADSESALDLINELKEKALAYYDEHAGETYVKCPECQSLFRLLMKVDGLEPAKATFFKGTTLYNVKLMELYHYKKLTLEEVAEILGVHTNYVIFIYENIYLKKTE